MEELKRQLQPKRVRTDDDAADAHEMLAEVDDWDLRDHRGSRKKQPKPRTGTDGFLYHVRLGLVGWISYWCCGGSRYCEKRVADIVVRELKRAKPNAWIRTGSRSVVN